MALPPLHLRPPMSRAALSLPSVLIADVVELGCPLHGHIRGRVDW